MSVLFDEKYKPSNEAANKYLAEASIHRVNVNTRHKHIEIILDASYWPSDITYRLVGDHFSELYPDNVDVCWLPCVEKEKALSRLIHDEPILLQNVIKRFLPTTFRWLREASWAIDGQKLTITLENDLYRRQLERLETTKELTALFERMTGTRPNIIYEVKINEEPEAKPLNLIAQSSVPDTESISLREGPSCRQPVIGERSARCKNIKGAHIVIGKNISSVVRSISEIVEEENKVCCEGTLFDLSVKELKTGRVVMAFSLTDLTDSIECKLFCEKDEADDVADKLKKASALKVYGNVQVDRYTQELTMMAQSINITTLSCRLDHAETKRVELHLHTQMSNMDGVSSMEELIKLASSLGHTHIAITDHGVVQAFPDAYQLGKKYGIHIIYGMEAYIFDDSIPDNQKPRTYHCILLAKNMTGLMNLYRLTTESHLRYFKRRPRIPKRLIDYAREGLIVGSACEAGELTQHLLHHPDDNEGLKEIASFYDYIEIQPIDNNAFMIRKGIVKDREDLVALNKRLWQLGQDIGKPVIATCDVHFAHAEDAIFRSILMASKGFSDAEEQAPLYYRTTDEMLEEFSYLGAEEAYNVVVENPNAVATEIEVLQPVPDKLFAPEIEGAEEEIERLTYEKAKALYGEDLPSLVQARIEKELKAIIGNGFAVLYLIAHELVRKSNLDGYIVGSRGSVGSSVVAYFTNITEVNALPPHYRCPNCCFTRFDESGTYGTGVDMPDDTCPRCGTALIKDGFNIPFEIFLGFKGDKVPDIDLNFSGEYQPRAHAFTETLFGKDNVFRAGTIATVADKTAFGYVRKYFDERGEFHRNAEINRLRNGCTGVKRTTGQHPGGLMVIPKGIDVHDFTPLQRPADDVKTETVTTHFDYHSINERLVKLDILGHDDPTVIKMLEDITGVDVRKIPLDDPETMSLFSSTEALDISAERLCSTVATYGIPEFNTKFTRQMLEDTKPDTFAALLRISGFSHGTDVWLNNAQDLIRSGTATVTETISTRDDIMIFLIQHGVDFSDAFSIMEKVRKGRGISEEHEAIMRDKNVPDWFIASCKKIKYLFPKAHAVAYVMMAYRIAWFKINHPLAFYASYFSVRGVDEFDLETVLGGETAVTKAIANIYAQGVRITAKDKAKVSVLEVALELLARGFRILPVNLDYSDATRFLIKDDALLPPLVSICGLGQTIATIIADARKEKPFISVEDLKNRGKVSDVMITEMRKLNIIDDLPDSNQIGLF